MTRDETLNLLRSNLPAIQAFGVAHVAIFGSVARDEASAESDVTVLVDFESTPTFRSYMGLLSYLEGLLGRPVDLADRVALRPEMRGRIEKEALNVA